MKPGTRNGYVLLHMLGGAGMGYIVLHPITMLVYSRAPGTSALGGSEGALGIIGQLLASFLAPMMPMSVQFLVLGAVLGGGAGLFSHAIARRDTVLRQQERQLDESVGALIRAGESRSLEFKSTLRWDVRTNAVNRALEETVVKTIAGFMNANGGTLLIGIDDEGKILGIEQDCQTLRKKNRDGFQQKLQELIATTIGANACTSVHVLFHQLEHRDVCRVFVEASGHPVYVRERGSSRFYLRTGNSTRELDVQEALQHIGNHGKDPRG